MILSQLSPLSAVRRTRPSACVHPFCLSSILTWVNAGKRIISKLGATVGLAIETSVGVAKASSLGKFGFSSAYSFYPQITQIKKTKKQPLWDAFFVTTQNFPLLHNDYPLEENPTFAIIPRNLSFQETFSSSEVPFLTGGVSKIFP